MASERQKIRAAVVALGCMMTLVVVTGAVTWTLSDDAVAKTSEESPGEAEPQNDRDDLRLEVSRLRGEVRRLHGRTQAAAPASDRAADLEATPASPPEASPPAPDFASEAAELRTQLEERLGSESSDHDWVGSVEASFGSAVDRVLALDAAAEPVSLQSVQCGISVCKMVISHASVDAFEDLYAELGSDEIWSGAGHANRERLENGYQTTFYLARPGKRLTEQ